MIKDADVYNFSRETATFLYDVKRTNEGQNKVENFSNNYFMKHANDGYPTNSYTGTSLYMSGEPRYREQSITRLTNKLYNCITKQAPKGTYKPLQEVADNLAHIQNDKYYSREDKNYAARLEAGLIRRVDYYTGQHHKGSGRGMGSIK